MVPVEEKQQLTSWIMVRREIIVVLINAEANSYLIKPIQNGIKEKESDCK